MSPDIASVTAEKTGPDENPVEGYDMELQCSFEGFPAGIETVEWRKIGESDPIGIMFIIDRFI